MLNTAFLSHPEWHGVGRATAVPRARAPGRSGTSRQWGGCGLSAASPMRRRRHRARRRASVARLLPGQRPAGTPDACADPPAAAGRKRGESP